ncbi:MAG: hypothetical protein PHP64_07965 [Actinomycetota bacterium]|nr:hypothetical protein [Actinomycetota bacterium]
MKIICVTSSSKKAGKTLFAIKLLREFQNACALKVSTGDTHGMRGEITTDETIISKKRTDTGSLVEAGAKRVIWVHPKNNPEIAIKRALGMLPSCDILVVEGGSTIEYLEPDLTVFIISGKKEDFKPSVKKIIAKADLILVNIDKSGEWSKESLGLEKPGKNPQFITFREKDREKTFEAAARMLKNVLSNDH